MVADMVRKLLPVIERSGIATGNGVDLGTLAQRIRAELTQHGATFKPPTRVGAWVRVSSR